MRNNILIIALAIASVTTMVIACTGSSASGKEATSKTKEEQVKRGEYLVNAIGCDDCHSPKSMGPNGPEVIENLRFSGYPADRAIPKADTASVKKGWTLLGTDFTYALGPWGISFAANLTSDETGIGNWKEEQFIKALREGKYKGLDGSRPLLPPMPWFVYKNMTDDDLKAIFAFLKSTKPVSNEVPAPKPWNELK